MAKTQWREIGAGMVVPVVLIAIWQVASTMGWVNDHVLPSPVAVVQRWIAYLLPQTTFAETGDN